MPSLKFDGDEYDLDLISEEAKRHIASIQFADSEISHLNAQLALYQTARVSHVAALKIALSDYGIIPDHLKQ